MNLRLETKVYGNYLEVMEKFDLDLFTALKPKGANMEIVQFTGSKKGDIVEIQFHSPLKAKWLSKITAHGSDEKKAYFIDEIYFSSGYKFFDFFLYPAMFLGFYPRKKVYRKYFGT